MMVVKLQVMADLLEKIDSGIVNHKNFEIYYPYFN